MYIQPGQLHAVGLGAVHSFEKTPQKCPIEATFILQNFLIFDREHAMELRGPRSR